jgi:outer membrane protein TolC
MKILTTVAALFLLLNMQAQAQNTRSQDSLSVDAIAKGLAQIAVENNGASKINEANVKVAEYNYKAQKTAWLDQFRASGNLNEYTLQRTLGTTPSDPNVLGRAFWPRYNFGVGFPFGIFVNQPKQTKVQYYRYQAELENQNIAKQNLGLQTMTAYYNYVQTQRLYELQEEAVQDASFAFTKTEEKFSKGEVPLDAYTATSRRYNTERATKVGLERDLQVNKAQLETLLGMPLETALQQVRSGRRYDGQRR